MRARKDGYGVITYGKYDRMSLKSSLTNLFARKLRRDIRKMADNALHDQEAIMRSILRKASHCAIGKKYHFLDIKDYEDFKQAIPVKGYEDMRDEIQSIIDGDKDVLWPGRPKYFAKTSGTTSGVKYIPISKESMPFHINTARNAILNYLAQSKRDIFAHQLIFLSGSPVLEDKGGIKTGRLSGIVNHEVPGWARSNQIPDYSTNCIEDWEEKLDRIVAISLHSDLSLISGIPPWVQMYYERLLDQTGKETVKDIFPNFQLFIHGGVNYKPYKAHLEKLAGAGIHTLETYPASEGFIAFQDTIGDESLLLNTYAGMFFEFIPVDQFFDDKPPRLNLSEVETGKDYALIISSNAGLWAYNIGDTIRFTSLNPYRLVVSGRIKHFISAFGEHVIAKEVEEAMDIVSRDYDLKVKEFTVAPQVNPPEGGLPYHEWLIECAGNVSQTDILAHKLDEEMIRQNIYYRDLIEGSILQTLKIRLLSEGSFVQYMKEKGKLGGQNKVPRLTNDREIADRLIEISENLK